MGRLLAIDYGLKRTGLAWTDPLKIIATGIGSFEVDELQKKLDEIAGNEEIEQIILGFPTRLDGSDTHATQPVLKFKKQLENQFKNIPVILWDERMTSSMAKSAMLEGGLPQKKRRDKHLVNTLSATIILQEFLETHS